MFIPASPNLFLHPPDSTSSTLSLLFIGVHRRLKVFSSASIVFSFFPAVSTTIHPCPPSPHREQ
jgi:hypothetical protein